MKLITEIGHKLSVVIHWRSMKPRRMMAVKENWNDNQGPKPSKAWPWMTMMMMMGSWLKGQGLKKIVIIKIWPLPGWKSSKKKKIHSPLPWWSSWRTCHRRHSRASFSRRALNAWTVSDLPRRTCDPRCQPRWSRSAQSWGRWDCLCPEPKCLWRLSNLLGVEGKIESCSKLSTQACHSNLMAASWQLWPKTLAWKIGEKDERFGWRQG